MPHINFVTSFKQITNQISFFESDVPIILGEYIIKIGHVN